MYTPNYDIPPERKGLYYLGIVVSLIGLLLFLSVFLGFASNFGNFGNFEGRARSSMMRAVLGIILLAAGSGLRSVGSRGLAGSGVLLDPQRARRDMEPWSRMSGGMANDALSEVDLANDLRDRIRDDHDNVKVRCRSCRALNDEDARFCDQCGATM